MKRLVLNSLGVFLFWYMLGFARADYPRPLFNPRSVMLDQIEDVQRKNQKLESELVKVIASITLVTRDRMATENVLLKLNQSLTESKQKLFETKVKLEHSLFQTERCFKGKVKENGVIRRSAARIASKKAVKILEPRLQKSYRRKFVSLLGDLKRLIDSEVESHHE